jgi:subtilisin family serine protease
MPHRIVLSALLAAAMLGSSSFASVRAAAGPDGQAEWAVLQARLQEQVRLRVLVTLQVSVQPEGRLRTQAQALQQRRRIAEAQRSLLQALDPAHARVLRQFRIAPVVAVEVDQTAFAQLASNPLVAQLQEDKPIPPLLIDSVPLIQADEAWALGYAGSGQAIAILDTGVDTAHEFLAGKVVGEACFSTTDAFWGSTTACPNGQPSQAGSGAGVNCDLAFYGCDHGTHVAGIAAGDGPTMSGVARGASLLAVQVFSYFDEATCGGFPCVLSFTSDQISALEWVYEQAADLDIASVNMSLGGDVFSDPCDTHPLKFYVDQLQAVGVATVIAAGNSGYVDAISEPGCISSAVTVGSTTKGDVVSTFSNVAYFLDLLAPGSSILSSVPGDFYDSFSGTSMAAPHVAGAWAVLKSKNPGASVDQVLTALAATGVLIDDTRAGGIEQDMPRIDLLAAVNALGAPPTSPPTATATGTALPSSTPTPSATASATPLPTATDTPSPTPSATTLPTDTDTPSPTPSSTPTATEAPSPTPSSTPTATDTPAPTDTATPEATATPTATDTPAPTDTPTPEATPTPAATDTPGPTDSPTPTSTAPAPTATPQPGDLNQDGSINVLDIQLCVNVALGIETDPGVAARADLNDDGSVNVLDVQLLVNLFQAG